MMNAFAPQGRRPCLLWSQVECVNVLVLIDNGELREFYELGGSRLIIGELLELGRGPVLILLALRAEIW